jgi:hypothetical protein
VEPFAARGAARHFRTLDACRHGSDDRSRRLQSIDKVDE